MSDPLTFFSKLSFLRYEAPNWMKHGHKDHLNIRNKFSKRFFPYPKISLLILDELEEPKFWGKCDKSAKLKGLEPWIHSKIGDR
jgi:hypothetical protein